MYLKITSTLLLLLLSTQVPNATSGRAHDSQVLTSPNELEIVLGETKSIEFTNANPNQTSLKLYLRKTKYFSFSNNVLEFSEEKPSVTVNVTGLSVTSREFVDVEDCYVEAERTQQCNFSTDSIYVTVTVIHSDIYKILIEITGWTYFIAWSLSFYPQAILNFQRKSVVGFNFDYGLLNVIGFFCYSVYNCALYFVPYVQELYIEKHERGAIPVLMNDVVFAVHAFFITGITGVQCFFYTRGNQRISYVCWAWCSVFAVVASGSLVLQVFGVFNWLQFITALSYIKLAVTCSKYIPPALYNFQRRSTVGWSIGTILLDFSGGILTILQMILQASNSDDWSIFMGNAVKCGLGVASVAFDVLFMVQHFCLFKNSHKINISVIDQAEVKKQQKV
ncbi:unnamed protein product [Bursaphelenchus okinawaensis]|uniref:Cystinosin-like protein n=1 Tax=Bursaphelenchus okinawaensis TaxID=465554 RepID=A0A811K955_9BILA|nr:unnamed protein product [Bursaphelenchus okinawaensis]CAG9097249.1 unnamed protein product [Bursaphelenchus okinawaensis]